MAIGSSKPGASAGSIAPSIISEPIADPNSLVPGRIDHVQWTLMSPQMAPRMRPIYANTGVTGPRSYIWVNYDGYCPSGGYVERPFTVPAGVTAIRIELDDVVLPTGVGSSPVFALQLYDSTGITQISTTSFTPTSTVTDVATPDITVSPLVEYRVRVVCNVSGQASFVCGRLRVRPTTTQIRFWEDFVRLDADHSVIQDSNEVGWANPRFPLQSEFSHVELLTNARSVYVEVFDNAGDYLSDRGKPSVFVNGDAIDPPLDTNIGAMAHCLCEIPAAAGMQRVSIVSGPQAITGLPAPASENRGSFIAGVYLPRTATTEVLQEAHSNAAETIVLYGDSKMAGFYSSSPGRDSAAFMLRRAGHRVICNTAGGDGLYLSTTTTLSVDACLPLARKLTRKNPTQVIVEIGRNDIAGGSFSAANLLTQLQNLGNAIHQVAPRCKVRYLTFTHETTTTETLYGANFDTVRAGVRGFPAALGNWCEIIDGAAMWSVAEAANYNAADGVHPNDAGQERIARGIGRTEHPWSLLQISGLRAWNMMDFGVPGGPAGTISSSGTTPPTITVTGTAVVAHAGRIEMKNPSGPRGTARMRASVDGGRSWIRDAANNQDILTAATVALGPTGLTANLPNETFLNNNVYTYVTQVASVPDRSGNSNNLVASAGLLPDFVLNGIGGRPACAFTPNDGFRMLSLNIAPPYSVYVVGKCTVQAASKALIGRSASGSGLLFYTNGAGTIAVNDGAAQIAATVNATVAHCYVLIVNGASSQIIVDGTTVATTGGPLTNVTLTGLTIGYDAPSGFGWDGQWSEFALFTGVLTSDEILAINARSRKLWQTA